MTRAKPSPWAARVEREGRETQTRSELLAGARTVFGRLGYARATVADIAAEAGLSRAGFYVYFASKEEVFRALAWQVHDAIRDVQIVPGVDRDDPAAIFEASIRAYLIFLAENLALVVAIEQHVLDDDEMRAMWEEINDDLLQRMARYITRLSDDGRAAPVVPPLEVARAVGGMCAHFARLAGRSPDALTAATQHVTAMYVHLLNLSPRRRPSRSLPSSRPSPQSAAV